MLWRCLVALLGFFYVTFAATSNEIPGPRATSFDSKGREVWKLTDNPQDWYLVRDFGVMKPTIVYNCFYMPTICVTINKYLGYLPTAGRVETFHFDIIRKPRGQNTNNNNIKDRHGLRGYAACPPSWIGSEKKPSGAWRCPETNQPAWTAYGYKEDTKLGLTIGPLVALLSEKPKNGKQNKNQLALKFSKVTTDSAGNSITIDDWDEYPVLMTCDEFPQKSFIEGGHGDDLPAPASTSCAPHYAACPGLASKLGKATSLVTDQGWQARATASLRTYLNRLTGVSGENKKLQDARRHTIYKFQLRTVNDPTSNYASWVEANGRTRFCHGPDTSGDGLDGGNCPGTRLFPGEPKQTVPDFS